MREDLTPNEYKERAAKSLIILKKDSLNFNTIYQACKNVLNLKDMRDHIGHLKIENSVMYATDGCALVTCTAPGDFTNGFYKPVSIKKSEIIFVKAEDNINYPEVKTIIKKYSIYTFHIDTFADHLPAIIAIKTNIAVSAQYTKIAFDMGIKDIEWGDNKVLPIKCICDGGVIYIMPIRIP